MKVFRGTGKRFGARLSRNLGEMAHAGITNGGGEGKDLETRGKISAEGSRDKRQKSTLGCPRKGLDDGCGGVVKSTVMQRQQSQIGGPDTVQN